jgi:DNA-binding HxlR family transcriptional regulator
MPKSTHNERLSRVGCSATREILRRMGDKWSLDVISYLRKGPLRFNELQTELAGISQRALVLALRGLERNGLVKRTLYPTIPPRVDYELTLLGHELLKKVMALASWVEAHSPDIEGAQHKFERTQTPGYNEGRNATSEKP